MAFEHRNRCGDVYLLQASKTRTNKVRYYFGRKLTGEAVEEVPTGYEVYESPERGQVFVRKERPTCITPIEREIVAEAIRCLSTVEEFIVDVEDDCLVVYVPTRDANEVNELVRTLAGPDALWVPRFRKARNHLIRSSPYEKVMRFQLLDTERRLFQAERWCFRSSHDSWMHLAGRPACLSDLVERYVEHLGEESFFELF